VNVQCGHFEKRVFARQWEFWGFYEQGDAMKCIRSHSPILF
jgi:hypothetical protein